ncbi:MAG: glycosyltransferase family 2 protein [Leptolyngbyaceae cyanobacterium CSU_1_4]|nr:glycosyltransferase family 2 protein [Leptolyngbyaceae cyanobacterium CSU_1_4]
MSAVTPTPSCARLRIIILNYRTPELTIACLHSLLQEVEALPGTQVTVVDNNSADGSVEKISAAIATEHWDWVTFLPQDRNGGYAFGNNVAIRPALAEDSPPDYILLLNPDTVVRPGALQALVDFMDKTPAAGIAGSRLEDPDGTPQCSAFRFPNVWSELDSGLRLGLVTQLLAQRIVPILPVTDVIQQVDWVAGASMMVRRQVFETAGLMDEKYFLYFEEVDFCVAANKAGWSCWYVPESRVVHYVGQSSGVTDTKRKAKRRPTYWFDSRRRFFVKNYGWGYAVLTEIAWASGFMAWRMRQMIQQKPDDDPPNMLGDFILNSVLLKGGGEI